MSASVSANESDDEGERVDPLPGGVAGIDDVEAERGGDLVVARPASVDLAPDLAEQPLDRRVHVLVRLQHGRRVGRELAEALLDERELVRREEPRAVKARRVLHRGCAVEGEELEVVDAQELPHGGIELALSAA